MKLGYFGGSFDPPHLAHTLAIFWALESGEIDRVIMAPVARHPFGKSFGASFPHRLNLCRLATERIAPFVRVSDVENQQDGPGYTINTLRLIKSAEPDAAFRLIVGSDILADLPKWRESEALLQLAPPLVVPRPGVGESPIGALPDISSSLVRTAIAAGKPLEHLLSVKVKSYITTHQLYQTSENQQP